MSDLLVALPITHDEAPLLLPLARTVHPALELSDWLAFAQPQIGRPKQAGIVAVRDERGYFHALFEHQLRHDPGVGALLDVGLVAAIDLLDRAGAIAVLLRALDGTAVKFRCVGARIHLRTEQRQLRRLLEDEGYDLDGVVLQRPLASA